MRRTGGELAGWVLVGPALCVFCVFALLPILGALGLSLFSFGSAGGAQDAGAGGAEAGAAFVGLANYAEAFTDGVFWLAILRNLALAFLSVAVQIPVALALACILAGRVRGRSVFRTALFAPVVLPTVVIAFFWRYFLLDPEDGLANAALGLLGSEGADWLHNPSLAFLAVFGAISWRYVGFHMVILLAGALSVPEELYDAARVDGAGAWSRFRHVTLPGMREALAISALLAVVGALKYFDLVYVMTGGGPEHATELGATWIYSVGIVGRRWGYGCALAVMLLALSLCAAWGVLEWRRRSMGEREPDAARRTARGLETGVPA
jgi:raffinose/stachyose/melibiose transport system permease protein